MLYLALSLAGVVCVAAGLAQAEDAGDKPVATTPVSTLKQWIVEGTSKRGKKIDGANQWGIWAMEDLFKARTPEATEALKEILMTYGVDPVVKRRIILSMGYRGTKEFLDSITEFEAWARKTSENPPAFRIDTGAYGNNGGVLGESYNRCLGECTDPSGKRWALVLHPFSPTGGTFWMTSALGNDQWSGPILVRTGIQEYPKTATLTGGPDTFEVRHAEDVKWTLSIPTALKDSDGDGSPDIREEWLGTDAQKPDSDGDGVPDGKDGNPLTPPVRPGNEDLKAIRQAAFTVRVATQWERVPVVLWIHSQDGNPEPQEFLGYGGPVLWSTERLEGFINVNDLTVKMLSETEAKVRIGFSQAMCLGSGEEYLARKIDDKWFIVDGCGGWSE